MTNHNDFLAAYLALEKQNDLLTARVENLIGAKERDWPEPVDIKKIALTEPEPLQEIAKGIPCGATTLLNAHGGAGKSTLALRLAICVSMGLDFFGLPVQQKKVLYLSCEDRESLLHHRARKIADHLNIEIGLADKKLFLIDAVGHDMTLWQPDQRGGNCLTSAYYWLKNYIAANQIEFVILDGAADLFGGNENSRGEVKKFVNADTNLVPPTGAVLLLAHVNKMTASTKTGEGYSGSTSWHNSVRSRWYLSTNEADQMLLQHQKSNASKTGLKIKIEWDDDAGTFSGEKIEAPSEFAKREAESEERDAILTALIDVAESGNHCPAAISGPRTAFHVLRQNSHFPAALFPEKKPNRQRFFAHLEVLRQMRLIKDDSIRRSNRHLTAVIVPTGHGSQGSVDASNGEKSNSDASGADATASMRHMRTGGMGGDARAVACLKCAGSGCNWCEPRPDQQVRNRVRHA